jgi:hypothetical protein
MHLTVVRMLHKASPGLADKFEHDHVSESPSEIKTGVNA